MTKFKSLSLSHLVAGALFTFGILSNAGASPLEGVWINTNPDSGSAPKIEIEIDSSDKATFIWWGKTSPENSKYGPFELKLYGRSPRDNKAPGFGTAVHETSFSDMHFALEMDGGYLKVPMFTEFKDDSGSDPYCVKMTFKKQ